MAQPPGDGSSDSAGLTETSTIRESSGENLPSVQEAGDVHDSTRTKQFFIVGIGASAGGLEALERFFAKAQPSGNIAYVVVQHLSPDFKSFMVPLLSKKTSIPVSAATDDQVVEPDRIYLIPPKKNLVIRDGRLRLVDQEFERGRNLPVDVFFRSLAEDKEHLAIAVILSGTGTDGTTGVRVIKDAGGLVLAQDGASAQFDGMPRSVINAGLADFVLPPEDMPERIARYINHPLSAKAGILSREEETVEAAINRIFRILRERLGVDFSQYKPSTIDRRIERRMTVTHCSSLQSYARFIEENHDETKRLFEELLISVTRFFRDPEAYEYLEKELLPRILDNTRESGIIRVWVPGCASGEEAYSLAILLNEAVKKAGISREIKVFATDIAQDALAAGSSGTFPASMLSQLPEHLQDIYVDPGPEGFEIKSFLRKMVVFARHNIVEDPPFTKLDLISCRNLLIYFNAALQQRVLSFFHFALKPGAFLFLGSSETVGEYSSSFKPVKLSYRIFENLSASRLPDSLPVGRQHLPTRTAEVDTRARMSRSRMEENQRLTTVYTALIRKYFDACIIINDRREVVHLIGRAGDYLRHPDGTFDNNVLRLSGTTIGTALGVALHRAESIEGDFVYNNIRCEINGEKRSIRLRILPIKLTESESLTLIVIERVEEDESRGDVSEDAPVTDSARVSSLESELARTKESLQATIEELETTNEELQATNEELLASNEELQSTNEELQSVNEELHTVNTENQNRIEELVELTNDINNLLKSSSVGTMLVDRDLRLRKISTAIFSLIGLSSDDVGAPIEIVGRLLNLPLLVDWSRRVLHEGESIEREVLLASGACFLVRLLPYRTEEETISGLVFTIIDITQHKRAVENLRESESRFLSALTGALDAFLLFEAVRNDEGDITDFTFRDMNTRAETLIGLGRDGVMGRTLSKVMPSLFRSGGFERYQKVVQRQSFADKELPINVPGIEAEWVHERIIPLGDRVAVFLRDSSREMREKENLLEENQSYKDILDYLPYPMVVVNRRGVITYHNPPWEALLAKSGRKEQLGRGDLFFDMLEDDHALFGQETAALLAQLKLRLEGSSKTAETETREIKPSSDFPGMNLTIRTTPSVEAALILRIEPHE